MNKSQWFKFQKEDLIKRVKNYSRTKALLFFSLIFGFLVSLISLGKKIFNERLIQVDSQVNNFISSRSSPFWKNFFEFITFFGSEVFIMIISLILLIFLIQTRRKRAATATLISLLGSAILVVFFKSFFGRERPGACPDHFLGGDSSCFSFPSGHSALSFYFYGLIAYLIFRFAIVPQKTRLLIGFIIGFLVILIAFSRLYLRVHFFSDVIGGFLLGGFWLTIAVFLIDFLY